MKIFNTLQKKHNRWLKCFLALSICFSSSSKIIGGSNDAGRQTYVYRLDQKGIENKIEKDQIKKKSIYYVVGLVTLFIATLFAFKKNDPKKDKKKIIYIDEDEKKDLATPINEKAAKLLLEQFDNNTVNNIPSLIQDLSIYPFYQDLKNSMGEPGNEWAFFTKNIKNGNQNEEEAMKYFCNNAKIVVNQGILNRQVKPSLKELAVLAGKKVKGHKKINGYSFNQRALHKIIKAFMIKYNSQCKSYSAINTEYPDLTKASFTRENDVSIPFTSFYDKLVGNRPLEDGSGTLLDKMITSVSDNTNELSETDVMNLFACLFLKLDEILDEHIEKVREEAQTGQKKYKGDLLNQIFSQLQQVEDMSNHCHGRTKRLIFDFYNFLDLKSGSSPQTMFGSIYWFFDEFKKDIVNRVIPYVITGVPPSQHKRLKAKDEYNIGEVHGHNWIMGLLGKAGIRFPGQEVAAGDIDAKTGTYAGIDNFLRGKIQKISDKEGDKRATEYVFNRYLECFSPVHIINNYAEYIKSSTLKIENIMLNIDEVETLYDQLVFNKKQEEAEKKLIRVDDSDLKNIIVQVRKGKLAYLLFRLGFFRLAKKGDKNVLTVANLLSWT
ncbi:MAG: hypothetical protein AAF335_01495 [Bacteroidota bacterium]